MMPRCGALPPSATVDRTKVMNGSYSPLLTACLPKYRRAQLCTQEFVMGPQTDCIDECISWSARVGAVTHAQKPANQLEEAAGNSCITHLAAALVGLQQLRHRHAALQQLPRVRQRRSQQVPAHRDVHQIRSRREHDETLVPHQAATTKMVSGLSVVCAARVMTARWVRLRVVI